MWTPNNVTGFQACLSIQSMRKPRIAVTNYFQGQINSSSPFYLYHVVIHWVCKLRHILCLKFFMSIQPTNKLTEEEEKNKQTKRKHYCKSSKSVLVLTRIWERKITCKKRRKKTEQQNVKLTSLNSCPLKQADFKCDGFFEISVGFGQYVSCASLQVHWNKREMICIWIYMQSPLKCNYFK